MNGGGKGSESIGVDGTGTHGGRLVVTITHRPIVPFAIVCPCVMRLNAGARARARPKGERTLGPIVVVAAVRRHRPFFLFGAFFRALLFRIPYYSALVCVCFFFFLVYYIWDDSSCGCCCCWWWFVFAFKVTGSFGWSLLFIPPFIGLFTV